VRHLKNLLLAGAITTLLASTPACRGSTPLTVSGKITDTDGIPPALTFTALLSLEDYSLSASTTTMDGEYKLEASGDQDYLLLVIPLSGKTIEGYNLHGYIPRLIRIPEESGSVTHDFTIVPCHEFILESYDTEGRLVLNDEWSGLRFVEDTEGNATDDTFIGIEKGEKTPSVPSVCLPLNQTRRLFVQWTLPEFGSVVLMADNDGKGYSAGSQGGTVLNLSYEIARTQINRLRKNIAAYKRTGYDIPSEITAGLNKAESLLTLAGSRTRAEQAALSDRASSTTLWTLENLEQARAEQDIPRYRTGGLTITVLDAAGNPLPDAIITYTQTSHDFLFGIFDTLENAGTAGYELMQKAGINYISTGYYWMGTEPKRNKISWELINREIGVPHLAEMGFTLKAHALLALWDFGIPDYFKKMDFEEADIEVYRHISALVKHYRDQIDIWNVINEAHGRGAALDFTRAEITTLTRTGIRAIRDHDPDARIIINNAFDWYGEIRQLTLLTTGDADNFTLPVPAYLKQLADDGIDYDIIGQQLYNGGYSDIFSRWDLGDPAGIPTWDLAHISTILDKLEKYGLPVHITEQSMPSTWNPDWEQYGAGWWHQHWNNETQAEYLHDFYTIAFSKKHLEAITWWNINDNNSFIFTGGLLDAENNPKPAYYALQNLIAGWTTTGRGKTDASGQITIRGYGGSYSITVNHNGLIRHDTAIIQEQQEKNHLIQTSEDVARNLPHRLKH